MSKDYTLSQTKWPVDERVHQVGIRGTGGWADDPEQLLKTRQAAERAYFARFGPRWWSQHVSGRNVLSREGHNFSAAWCYVLEWRPQTLVAFCTIGAPPDYVFIEWVGWAYAREVIDLGRHGYEEGKRYFGPFKPIDTFDPTELGIPRPRRRP